MENAALYESQYLPGIKPVLELLRSEPQRLAQVFCRKGRIRPELQEIKELCRSLGIACNFLDDLQFERTCAKIFRNSHSSAHQGVLARLRPQAGCSLEELLAQVDTAPLPLILALDQVQDSGNLGTLCRTLYALGGAGIILPRHHSAALGPGAHKAAAGALERLPIVEVHNLARAVDLAEEKGLAIYGAGLPRNGSIDGMNKIQMLNAFSSYIPLPAVLILGSEQKGLRPGVLKRCGGLVHIPLFRSFDSLNVAQAGAILMGLTAMHHQQQKNFRKNGEKL